MSTRREIPPRLWSEWLGLLSRLGMGRRARLEIRTRDTGDREQADWLSFQGADFDPKGSEAGSIDIILGSSSNEELSHHVERPTRIVAWEGDLEAVERIEIETGDGERVTLSFEQPVNFAVEVHPQTP